MGARGEDILWSRGAPRARFQHSQAGDLPQSRLGLLLLCPGVVHHLGVVHVRPEVVSPLLAVLAEKEVCLRELLRVDLQEMRVSGEARKETDKLFRSPLLGREASRTAHSRRPQIRRGSSVSCKSLPVAGALPRHGQLPCSEGGEDEQDAKSGLQRRGGHSPLVALNGVVEPLLLLVTLSECAPNPRIVGAE